MTKEKTSAEIQQDIDILSEKMTNLRKAMKAAKKREEARERKIAQQLEIEMSRELIAISKEMEINGRRVYDILMDERERRKT